MARLEIGCAVRHDTPSPKATPNFLRANGVTADVLANYSGLLQRHAIVTRTNNTDPPRACQQGFERPHKQKEQT